MCGYLCAPLWLSHLPLLSIRPRLFAAVLLTCPLMHCRALLACICAACGSICLPCAVAGGRSFWFLSLARENETESYEAFHHRRLIGRFLAGDLQDGMDDKGKTMFPMNCERFRGKRLQCWHTNHSPTDRTYLRIVCPYLLYADDIWLGLQGRDNILINAERAACGGCLCGCCAAF